MKQHPPTEISNPSPRLGTASSGATHCHPFLFLTITRENRSSCPPPSVQTGHGQSAPRLLSGNGGSGKPHPLPLPRAGGGGGGGASRKETAPSWKTGQVARSWAGAQRAVSCSQRWPQEGRWLSSAWHIGGRLGLVRRRCGGGGTCRCEVVFDRPGVFLVAGLWIWRNGEIMMRWEGNRDGDKQVL